MTETYFRVAVAAILVTNVAVSGYLRKRARRQEVIPRRAEGRLMLALRAAVALPVLFVVVAYVVSPPWMEWSRLELPAGVRAAAAVFGLGALPVLVHWVLSNLGRNVSETVLTKESHELVTSGPYRWVRHPLYSVGALLILTLGLVAASWLLMAAAVVVLLLVRLFIVPPEEEALEARFGDRYREYRRGTGALLPRIKG